MYTLESFPTAASIEPEEFIQGSRAELVDVTRRFCEQYNSDVGADYAREWEDFRDNIAPQSDSVQEWVKDHPLHIPFHDTLVRGDPIRVPSEEGDGYVRSTCAHPYARNRPRKSITLDYVNWSRRGEAKNPSDPSVKFPNIVVEGPSGIDRYSIPVHCKESKHSAKHLSTSGLHLPPLTTSDSSVIIPTEAVTVTGIESEREESDEGSADSGGDSTDSDAVVNDWVTCRGPHHIPRYYCARDCVGNTFTVPEKMLTKAPFGEKCPNGKIHSIVRRVGSDPNDVFFKFYNHMKYPNDPPPEDSDDFCYIPCRTFMSSDESRRNMVWDSSYHQQVRQYKPRARRGKKRTWAYEPVHDNESDEDDAAVLTRPRKLRSGKTLNSQPINDGMCDSVEENCLRNTAAATVVSDLPRSSDLSTRDLSGSRVVPHPPVQVQREMLRQQIHQSLVRKGIRKDTDDNIVELSDITSESDSESDSDSASNH